MNDEKVISRYYVAYHYWNDGVRGSGRCFVNCFQYGLDIIEAENWIKRNVQCTDVVIISIIPVIQIDGIDYVNLQNEHLVGEGIIE